MRSSQTFATAVCWPAFLKKLAALLCFRSLALLALASSLVWPTELRAQNALQHEYEIKAAYLYNFINYIDWPAETLPAAGGTITIGIIGENPFGSAFENLNGKQIKGRTLAVKTISSAKDLDACQMVFVCASEKNRLPEVLSQLKDSRILTVSEIEGFAEQGGIINFISERNKVRFEINLDAARHLGLTISSELLKLAKLVKS